MGTTKLEVYSQALLALGQKKLSSLTENSDQRRVLDDYWTRVTLYALEQGQWNFAMKAVEIESEAGIEGTFGYAKAFLKPDDLVRLAGLSSSEYFDPPLTRYLDESGYWWADIDPIYVRYVSDEVDYGMALERWPETFTKYVYLYLASQIAPRLTIAEQTQQALDVLVKRARTDARSKDAMGEAPGFRPQGSWSMARAGRSGRRYDRA
jgi:hypothetical protein